MFSYTAAKIFICIKPVDLRCSFDGLSGIVNSVMNMDPCSGHLFIFKNKRADMMKILYFDRDGMAIWSKRLERGTFKFPIRVSDGSSAEIDIGQLHMILSGFDVAQLKKQKRFSLAKTEDRSA